MDINTYPKTFDSYSDALKFYNLNKDKVPEGMVMGISKDGRTLNLSEIFKGFEVIKSSRPKESSYAGYGSDYLPGGINGIINHADGKRYDSKSQYERAVRAKRCRIVGNDWNNQDLSRKQVYGDYNVKPQLKQALEKVLNR